LLAGTPGGPLSRGAAHGQVVVMRQAGLRGEEGGRRGEGRSVSRQEGGGQEGRGQVERRGEGEKREGAPVCVGWCIGRIG
jgi:hypothetical protein